MAWRAPISNPTKGRLTKHGSLRRLLACSASSGCDLHRGIYRTRSTRTARGVGAMERREAHRVDRHATSFRDRDELAAAFHVPESNVRVIVPDMGSAYGGKHTSDAALEAARLARAAGRPVKIVWTREEEFTWAYFRPAGVIEVKSAIDSDGKSDRVGIRQLSLRHVGHRNALCGRQSTCRISRRAVGAAQRLVSGVGRHGQSFRARDAHGCAWRGPQNRSACISIEESFRCANARGVGNRHKIVWLASKENERRPGIWFGRGQRKRKLCGHLCGNCGRRRTAR